VSSKSEVRQCWKIVWQMMSGEMARTAVGWTMIECWVHWCTTRCADSDTAEMTSAESWKSARPTYSWCAVQQAASAASGALDIYCPLESGRLRRPMHSVSMLPVPKPTYRIDFSEKQNQSIMDFWLQSADVDARSDSCFVLLCHSLPDASNPLLNAQCHSLLSILLRTILGPL